MKQRKYLPLVLFFLILVFIWGQSILPPRVSDSQSRFIAIYLVKWFGRDADYVNHIIRKCAHFAEFAVLGAAAAWLFGKRKCGYVFAGLIGFGCAFLDETIQIFSSRGPAISDVWLDFSGVLFGLLIGMVLGTLGKRRNP
ncbi:MAG: VanZ family protein [Oscillospiraceae bacterium]|nr:VanZ family protein [Oscillospiraceae bacterium]